MQLIRKKSLFLIVSIPIIIFLVLLTTGKQQFIPIKADLTQKIMALDLGFSSFRNLTDSGEGRLEFPLSQNLITLINSTPRIFKYKLFNESKFERIDISINFSDYLSLMEDRKRAIKDKILSNPTKVNASLEYKGKKYKSKLRLKGDIYSHWRSKHRFSLRVEIKNGKNILGFSRFSIQKPRERQYPYDQIFQTMIRDAGNLASTHKFANVFVNGDDWGIMNIEEHVSKEFLEKQNRKSSIIVRFSNEEIWLYNSKSKIPYDLYRLSDPSLFLHLYNSKSIKDKKNRKAYSYILNKIISNDKDLYDINSFSKALIMSLVWNETHTLDDSNSKYYFNPYTLKIEPVTTDQMAWRGIADYKPAELNSKYINILSNQKFIEKLPINIKKIKNTISNIDKYLIHPHSLFPVDKKKNTNIIKDNMREIEDVIKKIRNIKNISNDKNSTVESTTLPSKDQASEFTKHLHIMHYSSGIIELHNLLPDNVIVRDLLFNGKSFLDKEIVIPSYLSNPNPTIIKTNFKGIQDKMFTIKTHYQGFDRVFKNDITLVSVGIKNPLLLNTANDFDFINKLSHKSYEIKPGNWIANKPIIIEGDLKIPPGVNLQFSKNSYLIVKGSLSAIGTKENPINLKPILNSWKGIYVLNAATKSQLSNVNISNISSLEDELLSLTGGITFYQSDIDFRNIRIDDIKAEDAINIVESSFSLNSVIINNTISDGLDSDFSKGKVEYSEFSNIGGDALDFSGSYVSINQTKAINIKDKAVSAGESSTLNIKNSNFKDVGVGVASKDGSSVNMSNSEISNYNLYGVMSYIKKDFYPSMTSINIDNSSISNGNAFLRQKGTNMIIDNIEIPESEISIEKLYKNSVMSK
jgi:hypothetical protein